MKAPKAKTAFLDVSIQRSISLDGDSKPEKANCISKKKRKRKLSSNMPFLQVKGKFVSYYLNGLIAEKKPFYRRIKIILTKLQFGNSKQITFLLVPK